VTSATLGFSDEALCEARGTGVARREDAEKAVPFRLSQSSEEAQVTANLRQR
jgi:hypothetical protein